MPVNTSSCKHVTCHVATREVIVLGDDYYYRCWFGVGGVGVDGVGGVGGVAVVAVVCSGRSLASCV